jgi:hypothetical protein
MGTPVRPVYFVPFNAGRVKVGQAQLEDVEGGGVFEEEIGCDGYLWGFGVLALDFIKEIVG